MATEVFSWGFTGWLTQRFAQYELSGFILGAAFSLVLIRRKRLRRRSVTPRVGHGSAGRYLRQR